MQPAKLLARSFVDIADRLISCVSQVSPTLWPAASSILERDTGVVGSPSKYRVSPLGGCGVRTTNRKSILYLCACSLSVNTKNHARRTTSQTCVSWCITASSQPPVAVSVRAECDSAHGFDCVAVQDLRRRWPGRDTPRAHSNCFAAPAQEARLAPVDVCRGGMAPSL